MKKWTDENLLEYLADVMSKHGGDISKQRFSALPDRKYSVYPYCDRWGNWTEAKRHAVAWAQEKGVIIPVGEEEKYVIPSEIEDISLSSYTELLETNTLLAKQLTREKKKTKMIVDACMIGMSKINREFVTPSGMRVEAPEDIEFHALRSDAQVGERVEKDEVQGVSEYNSDIYAERLERWGDKIELFKKQDRKSLGLNKLVVTHLGDQIEGETVYAGQSFYIDQPAVDQLFMSVELETKQLLRLAGLFNKIEVFCVPGNHGRLGVKGQHHKRTNMDYIFYKVLKMALQHQPNVRLYVSESPGMIVKHGEYVFAYKHGEHIRSYVGLPYYGLERDYHRMQVLYNMRIHYEFVGHHHQPANIKDNIFVNGAMVGGSDLSINVMTQSNRPSQTIFYFDHKEGINRETKLYLADLPKFSPDKQGVFTAYS